MKLLGLVTVRIYLMAVIALCVFVPWRIDYAAGKQAKSYSLLWDPPCQACSVDLPRLAIGLIALTAVALLLGAYETLAKSRTTRTPNPRPPSDG